MDMYHLGGNAFFSGALVYLPVAKLIIILNLRYVPIKRVERKRKGGRCRRIDLRCFR